MCDMTHSYVLRDSFICVTCLIHTGHDSLIWDMPRVFETCLIPVRHACFVCGTWLIHMGHDSFIRDMTHSYVWHYAFICDMTHSYGTSFLYLRNNYEWVMSHMNESCPLWMSHVPYEWVMSLMNESCPLWMSHDNGTSFLYLRNNLRWNLLETKHMNTSLICGTPHLYAT